MIDFYGLLICKRDTFPTVKYENRRNVLSVWEPMTRGEAIMHGYGAGVLGGKKVTNSCPQPLDI